VEWNGKFRKITVKTQRPKTKLLYRTGYFAISDPINLKEDPLRVVMRAMQPDAPGSMQFIMEAKVIPPATTGEATKVDIFIDVYDLSTTEQNGQKTPEVYFVAVAWDHDGKASATFSQEFHTDSQTQYEALLRTGMHMHQEMALKAGSYQLRLGVMDRLSGRIGTLDVPVTIAKEMTAK